MNDIIKALEIIKATCEKYETCNECVLCSNEDGCSLRSSTPSSWKIRKEEVIRL